MDSKNKRFLSIRDKVEIIREIERGVKNTDASDKYDLAPSTISALMKNKERYITAFENNVSVKRVKKSEFGDVGIALLQWYNVRKNSGIPVNNSVLKQKAEEFARNLGHENFVCNSGWLHRFKNRHNIYYRKTNDDIATKVVYKCSVMNCQKNYKRGRKIRVFSFPTDEALLQKWLEALPSQDNFFPTLCSKVCENHFQNTDFITEEFVWDEKNNSMKMEKLKIPKLKSDAVPSIFPDSIKSSMWNIQIEDPTDSIKKEPPEICDDNHSEKNTLDVIIKQEYSENNISDENLPVDNAILSYSKCISCGHTNLELFSLFEPRYNGEIKEVYSAMIFECFGIKLFDGIEDVHKKIYMICELCVLRLRDAHIFKTKIQDEQDRLRDLSKSSWQLPNREESKEDFHKSSARASDDHHHLTSIKISDMKSLDAHKTDMINQCVESYIDMSLLKCKICDEYFIYESELRKHMSVHFPDYVREKSAMFEEKLKSRCSFDGGLSPIFKLTKSCEINNSRAYTCDVCKKSFTRSYSLKKHIETHKRIKVFRCKLCDKCFTTMYSLNDHRKRHDTVKSFMCDYCDKSYTTKAELQRHIISHMGLRNYRCEVCSKTYMHNKHLLQHMLVHQNVRNYICNYCEKNFKSKTGLYLHIMTRKCRSERFDCKSCDKFFVTKHLLSLHEKKHENTKRSYSCGNCNRSFSSKRRVSNHTKSCLLPDVRL